MTLPLSPARPAVLADDDGLAVIGRTLHDLRGIRFDNGTGGNAPAPQQSAVPAPPPGVNPPAPEQQPAPAPASPPAPAPAAPAPAQQPAAPALPPEPAINPRTGQPFTPAESQARIQELNREAQTNRERAETAERERDAANARANDILRAAGFNPDGTPYTEITPEAAAAAISGTTAERDTAVREALLLRVVGTTEHRANGDALLDSRDFVGRLSAIGTTDRAGVEALVDEFVQKDAARYGTTPPPAVSSGGAPQHTGTPNTPARQSKADAIAARYPGRAASPGTAATT
jgi:hypothetical protein